jgi:cytochrome c556
MPKVESISKLSDALWENPSKENWANFSKALKSGIKSGSVKYYRAVSKGGKPFDGRDLKGSCAEILDQNEKIVTKVPMFMVSNGKTTDVMDYLKVLSDIREKEKEYLMQQKLKALGYM